MFKTDQVIRFSHLIFLFVCLEVYPSAFSLESAELSNKTEKEIKGALLKTLVQNPEKALKRAQRVKASVERRLNEIKAQDLQIGVGQMLQVYAQAEEESPIFLLDECDAEHCSLSRCNTYEYRRAYENHVVPSLVSKMTERPLTHYVSFGSGKMFQDLIILAKALTQKPDGKVEVHLIETGYRNFCDYRNALKLTLSVDPDMEILPELYDDALTELCQIRSTDSLSTDRIRLVQEDYLLADQTARQLVKFLQGTFEEAEVNVLLHKSKDGYLQYIRGHNKPYSDIVTSADIQDDLSFMLDGISHYSQLCKEVLLHKDAHTSLLALPGKIVSFSLDEDQKNLIEHVHSISAPYLQCKRLIKYIGIGVVLAAIYYTTEIKK